MRSEQGSNVAAPPIPFVYQVVGFTASTGYQIRGPVSGQISAGALLTTDKACAGLAELIRLAPQDPQPYVARGLIESGVGRSDEAIADFDRAIRLAPTEGLTYYSRGLAHSEAGHTQQAYGDLFEAIRLKPCDALLHLERAKVAADLGDIARSIDDFTQVLRLSPGNVEALVGRAAAFQDQGDFNRSIADTTQALTIDSGNARAWLGRALTQYYRGDYPAAIGDYTKALTLSLGHQDCLEARLGLALASYANGDIWAAINYFGTVTQIAENTLEDAPAALTAHYSRGMSFDTLKETDQAIAAYTAALKIAPGEPLTLAARARDFEDPKNYRPQQAIDDYSMIIKIEGDNIFALLARAKVLGRPGGNTTAAIDDYSAVLRILRDLGIDPNTEWIKASRIEALLGRGQGYENKGKIARALSDFSAALLLAPDNQAAQDAVTRLNPPVKDKPPCTTDDPNGRKPEPKPLDAAVAQAQLEEAFARAAISRARAEVARLAEETAHRTRLAGQKLDPTAATPGPAPAAGAGAGGAGPKATPK